MTTYKTLNPLPSTDVRDLFDNAENLDFAMNDRERAYWLDRFGISRWTWNGLEGLVSQALASVGYVDLGAYQAGLVITNRQQVFLKDGEYWRASADLDLPYTTTGVWATESSLFVGVGDAILRQDLAARVGAQLVGFSQDDPDAAFRDLLTRGRDTPTALDYVVSPGVDDTVLLQKLLDKHLYAEFVGPQHTFVVRGTLRLRNGHRLDLRGAKIIQAQAQTPIFDAQNTHGVRIYGGELIGAKSFLNSPSSMDIGILADGATDIAVWETTFRDFGYAGYRCQVGGEQHDLRACHVFGFANELGPEDRNHMGFCLGGSSIALRGSFVTRTSQGLIVVEKSNTVLLDSTILRDIPVEHGAYLDTSLKNVNANALIVRNVGHMGVKVQWYDAGDFGRPENISLSNLTIYGTGDAGIAVLNSQPTSGTPLYGRNFSVTNSTIYQSGAGGFLARYVENLNVSGLTGENIAQIGMSFANILSGSVSNCELKTVQQNGLEVYGPATNNLLISGLHLHNTGLVGTANPAASFGMTIGEGTKIHLRNVVVTSDTFNMSYGVNFELPTNVGSTVENVYIRGYYTAGLRLSSVRDAFDKWENVQSFGQDHNDAIVNFPNVVMRGDGNIRKFAHTGVPTTGTYIEGDRLDIIAPAPGQPSRYRCVLAGVGSAATWRVETRLDA